MYNKFNLYKYSGTQLSLFTYIEPEPTTIKKKYGI